MGAFYSAFVGRDLTRSEVSEVTRQMLRQHGARGRSREQIRDIARSFDDGTHGAGARVSERRADPARRGRRPRGCAVTARTRRGNLSERADRGRSTIGSSGINALGDFWIEREVERAEAAVSCSHRPAHGDCPARRFTRVTNP
jgi:hypothetical protein